MVPPCLPFSQCPAARLSVCRGLFTDIDDTLTADGAITPEALQALCDLRDAGIPVIAITGRPMGWSACFVQPGPQAWPVMAIVAENGAVALLPQSGELVFNTPKMS